MHRLAILIRINLQIYRVRVTDSVLLLVRNNYSVVHAKLHGRWFVLIVDRFPFRYTKSSSKVCRVGATRRSKHELASVILYYRVVRVIIITDPTAVYPSASPCKEIKRAIYIRITYPQELI